MTAKKLPEALTTATHVLASREPTNAESFLRVIVLALPPPPSTPSTIFHLRPRSWMGAQQGCLPLLESVAHTHRCRAAVNNSVTVLDMNAEASI